MEKSPKIICEIGCNHLGNFDIAMEMIKTAAEYCKVDIIKFQKTIKNYYQKTNTSNHTQFLKLLWKNIW